MPFPTVEQIQAAWARFLKRMRGIKTRARTIGERTETKTAESEIETLRSRIEKT